MVNPEIPRGYPDVTLRRACGLNIAWFNALGPVYSSMSSGRLIRIILDVVLHKGINRSLLEVVPGVGSYPMPIGTIWVEDVATWLHSFDLCSILQMATSSEPEPFQSLVP